MKRFLLIGLFVINGLIAQSTVNLGRTLPVIPPPSTPPVFHVENFGLTSLPAGTTTTYTYTLMATPIASMGAEIHFKSSQVGGDVYAPIVTITQTIIFTLPTYTPFTVNDQVYITYYSTK